MSEQTLRNIERAIEEHYQAEVAESAVKGMVVDWVVGFTVHGVVEIEDEGPVSAYANWYAAADSNPNASTHLAQWVSDEIAMSIGGVDDSEDD
jgi:hypothetical protein